MTGSTSSHKWLFPSYFVLVVAGFPAPHLRAAPSSNGATNQHWSFLPLDHAAPPPVQRADWPETTIDRFILARLEAHGLQPAPPASRRDLIRRLSFDLLGLPPSPEQVEAFAADTAPDAYERLVDQFLSSPHYGERWGQHWFDVVRYAESEGFEYDRHLPGIWRYRDYVIAAFNSDKPYDEFVTQQLAGDEREAARPEDRIAAGFHRLGAVRRNAGNQAVASSRNEVLTERTDIIGAAFLGLTVGCARCHDHKFDPISQKDYYLLQAFLAATREYNHVLASEHRQTEWQKRTDRIEAKIKRLKTQLEKADPAQKPRLEARLRDAENALPPPLPTISTVRNVEETRTAIHVLKRGDWEKKGARVGMRALSVLLPDGQPELAPHTDRPRTRLGAWIADTEHPLTARVIANRIWHYHFGQGLVNTPNDFGLNGDRPSHPELLDHLAALLIAHDWRIKPLHRLILLSETYRQASRSPHTARAENVDPENRWLWRFNRRRLEAEEIRDAMLTVSGRLNRKSGGPSVIVPVDQELVDLLYKPAQWAVTKDRSEHDRRSIYLIAKRNLQLPFLEVFDRPTLQTSCPRREASTHAPQALELLNGRVSNELAGAFADRIRREVGTDRQRQVERAFRLAVGRPPTARERQPAVEFLEEHPLREFALAMFNLNEFLYVK